MNNIKVELLSITPLWVVVDAIRTCYDSLDKSDSVEYWYWDRKKIVIGKKDRDLIRKIIKNNHTSTLEHITFSFKIEGISRGCLQQLVRHRLASYSVQSTRYTLSKRLKNEAPFVWRYKAGNEYYTKYEWERADKYIVLTGDEVIDKINIDRLETLRMNSQLNVKNDKLKYMLPEAFRTELIWTINARSLRNFLKLRLDKRAHFEIRVLAEKIIKVLPEEYLILFKDILEGDDERDK